MTPLTNTQRRALKARAQLLKAQLKVGKQGLTPQLLQALDEMLRHHDLIKVRFDEFKEEKDALAAVLAEKTHSHLVTRLGNIAVIHRPKPALETPPAP